MRRRFLQGEGKGVAEEGTVSREGEKWTTWRHKEVHCIFRKCKDSGKCQDLVKETEAYQGKDITNISNTTPGANTWLQPLLLQLQYFLLIDFIF